MRLSTALLACAVPSVLSWGNVGHRTVGYLAEKYLTDEAAALVGKLLANDRNYDISDAATWADTLRGHMGWASKYHYINCPSSGCVISAIQNYVRLHLM
ncbi:hypothetical protein COL154_005930 [Colletotrichum chrysophilum]|nr:hypothetical protein COL154_005930 [Colletotrichum chrysophilum]